ncbi:hypothetical protein Bhz51_00246 [Stenotrophomonas phage vB_SmaM_Bhz51]
MRMCNSERARQRVREEDVRHYHGFKRYKRVGICIRCADRQEARKVIAREL